MNNDLEASHQTWMSTVISCQREWKQINCLWQFPTYKVKLKLLVTLNLNSESLSTVTEVFLLRLWLQLFKPNPSITHLIFTVCLFGWPSTTRLTVVFPWCQWDLILTIKTCYLGGIFQTIMLSFRKKNKIIAFSLH